VAIYSNAFGFEFSHHFLFNRNVSLSLIVLVVVK